ncbi:MAG: 30S ribosomal protein S5, small subunit ribosomal protein S5 [Candidatus Peregrinibacteria bacterium GW2011_GWF2_33_10]|nr:MAG: 30S ribosomal protein S5, small subunit ribosomal protein S5 [Candidatus Peregrinibacteria bacterium GW2011_GWF2_33_10]OGJ46120.1 MAG: 30S ribosomal protein S5 [Candidatus Peregrinibacteria bacterium RIFOXYA12_FULL_33_12]OGJ46174.1 MAG: 30S ribosomal protein S5 [Candidatus Peregrinibacteria bacterium RIFOXYA2_FULL_33_21]OGJ51591.1 MAG: 30S ribosomal protein S5 [Candidatus Peregrinibacteria bacterium RIFOXYB2_FULL_33_20]
MSKANSQKGSSQKEFEEILISLDRVTKVTAGGRQLKFRAFVVVGNKNGKVGLGMGKSNEVTGSIQKAVNQAKKNFMRVPLNGFTIPHEISVKFKSAKVLLMPAAPGTGLIAGSSIRQILDCAGVKDVLAKRFGTTNKINNAKATMKALALLRELPWKKNDKNKDDLNNNAQKNTTEIQLEKNVDQNKKQDEGRKEEPKAKVVNKTNLKKS